MPLCTFDIPAPTQRGRQARLNGVAVTENPYRRCSSEAIAWMAAWFQEDIEFNETSIALVHERGRTGH